jgi:DNA-binding CsgD family transcriptional regulator
VTIEQQRVLLVKYGITPFEPAQYEPVRLSLSSKQRETMELYAKLGTQKAVATAMKLSLQTVKNHIADAYRRLGATNAIEAFTILGWLSVRDVDHQDDTPDTSTGSYWTLRKTYDL